MEIITYDEIYKQQIIDLILHIQNDEAKIGLSIEEQPDLLDIYNSYINNGGNFWIAVEQNTVIGTIGLMIRENRCDILKKFFVKSEYRGQRIGCRLYRTLISFAENIGLHYLILDTPSVAKRSHKFYEQQGFTRITKVELPIEYQYPDRDSLLYLLELI
ncbi:MAG: GNAT family N-acetyltransferase [Firmicutes bacterium]|nr:GNAT family N-acetyltransferase [Bacillota bacterium]